MSPSFYLHQNQVWVCFCGNGAPTGSTPLNQGSMVSKWKPGGVYDMGQGKVWVCFCGDGAPTSSTPLNQGSMVSKLRVESHAAYYMSQLLQPGKACNT